MRHTRQGDRERERGREREVQRGNERKGRAQFREKSCAVELAGGHGGDVTHAADLDR